MSLNKIYQYLNDIVLQKKMQVEIMACERQSNRTCAST